MYTKRLRQVQVAQTKLLRGPNMAHAQRLERYKKQLVFIRAKAKVAVAWVARKCRDGLAEQASAYNKRFREKMIMYEKGTLEEEKRKAKDQGKAEQWKTWWSKLPVEYRDPYSET